MHREGDPYPKLEVVYLYPSTFSSVMKQVDEFGIVTEDVVHRLGESWGSGSVVLAWDSVAHGARDIFDGGNVIFHEFAHRLITRMGLRMGRLDSECSGLPFLGAGVSRKLR